MFYFGKNDFVRRVIMLMDYSISKKYSKVGSL